MYDKKNKSVEDWFKEKLITDEMKEIVQSYPLHIGDNIPLVENQNQTEDQREGNKQTEMCRIGYNEQIAYPVALRNFWFYVWNDAHDVDTKR